MSVYDIINIVVGLGGGLALFLYGMNMLGSGLEKVSGSKMEKILQRLTSNVFVSVLFGALATAAVQSSSATTVIVVGLVNAGLLKLRNAVGVIMGANIGTTVTAQILRLSDLEGAGNFLSLFKPTTIAPLVSIFGILIFMVAKRNKYKDLGQVMLGFGILFTGMFAMESAVRPLSDLQAFRDVFATLQNPVLGVLAGAIVTALIQSSSASIGILQAISSTGVITYASAFPIIMGQNIGTCITPILSSIGASKNAKRAAMVHLYFNIIGTIVFLSGVYAFQHFVGFGFWENPITRGGIANFHTIFNVVVTILFLPFTRLLAKLAELTIRDEKYPDDQVVENDEAMVLDERFLSSPGLAISQCETALRTMADYARSNYRASAKLFAGYDPKAAERIREQENVIDRMEDKLGNYLLLLTDRELTEQEGKMVTQLLHLISEFERIGDYSINLVERAELLYEKQLEFSKKAKSEMAAITSAVSEIVDLSYAAFTDNDMDAASRIEPLEETIDMMEDTLKFKHIERLKKGKCKIDTGIIFLEALTNLERIADHCSNIAVFIIGNNNEKELINHHDYIRQLHKGETNDYTAAFETYTQKYLDPIR